MGTTRHDALIATDLLGFPLRVAVNTITMHVEDLDVPDVDVPRPLDRVRAAALLLGYDDVETLPHRAGGGWRMVFVRREIEPGESVITLDTAGRKLGSGRLCAVVAPHGWSGETYVVDTGSGRRTVGAVRRPAAGDAGDVEWGVWLREARLFLRRDMFSQGEANGWVSRAYAAGLRDATPLPVTEELLAAEVAATLASVDMDSRLVEGALAPVPLAAEEPAWGWSLGSLDARTPGPGDFAEGLAFATDVLARRLGRRPVAWIMHRDGLGEWFTPRWADEPVALPRPARPAPCPRCFNPDRGHECLDLDDMAVDIVDRLVVDRGYPVDWTAEDVRRALPAFLRAIYAAPAPREEA